MLKNPTRIKYLVYVVFGLVFFAVQATPGIFGSFGVGFMPLIPLAVSIAIYENSIPACIIAIYIGFLCDLLSSFTTGYYSLMLFTFCLIFNTLSHGLLKPTLLSSIIYSFIVTSAIFFLGYIFLYALKLRSDSLEPFIKYFLPTAVYTGLLELLIYPMIKRVYTFFGKLEQKK